MRTSLFPQSNQEKQPSTQAKKVSEQLYIQPLTTILENVTPKQNVEKPHLQATSAINKSLDELFPEQQHDEKNIQKAKQILGPLVKDFNEEQLKCTINEIEYLTESWLDDFERQIFEGLTLNELLHERGGK